MYAGSYGDWGPKGDRLTRSLIRVVIAAEPVQIRTMLRHALERDGRFEIADEIAGGDAIVERIVAAGVDAVVIDLGMTGGTDTIKALVSGSPKTKVVVLSGVVEMGADVLNAGAHGFFDTTAAPTELASTIAELMSRDN